MREFFGRPPARLFHAVIAVPTLGLLWAASTPSRDLWLVLSCGAALAVCAGWWVVRLVIAVALRARLSRWWAVAPLAGVLVAGLVAVDAPLHARWTLAEDELTEIAQALSAPDRPDITAADLPTGRRIGTYRVAQVDIEGRVVHVDLDGGGHGGLLYVPDGVEVPPAPSSTGELHHLRGNWYHWEG